ncbi:MAG: osmoprotectant transport system permease protein [Actinomycetota bacterium]|nr:osmoprotectant transport system permease protein [Actinomycetota bacterium]
MNEPFVRWDWIADHSDQIGTQLLEHIYLTALAIGIGFLIAFPLALIAYRYRRLYAPIAGITGILYTIPSLALFAVLQSYTGLSTTTAEIGLVSYTLLILIRNVVSGLDGVPADVREAARGMGYSPRQILWRVDLPLAAPVIAAGVRIATVTTIGLVTVTALIGKGGLGYFILLGIRGLFPTAALLGSVLSVALAVVVDASLLAIQKALTPWSRTVRARTVS